AWMVGRSRLKQSNSWRWLSRLPIAGELLLILVVGGLITHALLAAQREGPPSDGPKAPTALPSKG
ncbi:MAG: hypothetical protein ACREIA_09715, partial [Opitutaceae bacterium]